MHYLSDHKYFCNKYHIDTMTIYFLQNCESIFIQLYHYNQTRSSFINNVGVSKINVQYNFKEFDNMHNMIRQIQSAIGHNSTILDII